MNLSSKRGLQAWQIEFIVLGLLTLLAAILFRNSDLDFWAARKFYHPENLKDAWNEAQLPLWLFFYHAAPWFTAILLLGSLGLLLLAQIRSHFRKFRIYAVFVFLAVGLGPGLVVNAILKPYWGRPRPREVIELGGHHHYRPYYESAVGEPGKSFPCGHCSVGFAFGIFWLLLKRKNLLLASGALVGSVILGGLMGVGRIADGGHFFSDVVWAGLITWGIALWLFYFALKIPEREANPDSPNFGRSFSRLFENRIFAYSIYAGLFVFTLGLLLTASPFYKEIEYNSGPATIQKLTVHVDQGDLEILINPNLNSAVSFGGTAKGFGFPKNHVDLICQSQSEHTECSLDRHGFFTDYESNFKIEINPKLTGQLDFYMTKGHVSQLPLDQWPANYHVIVGAPQL